MLLRLRCLLIRIAVDERGRRFGGSMSSATRTALIAFSAAC